MTSSSSHTWLGPAATLLFMAKMQSLSEILSANLKRLMEENEEKLGSQTKIAAKTIPRIGQRTVGRAINGEVSTTIGSVESLSRAFKVDPWELLNPAMVSKAQQTLTPEQKSKVQRLRREIGELSPPAKRDLLGNVEEIQAMLEEDSS